MDSQSESDLADSYVGLDKYFQLNIKMLLAMGILVDLNGTKSFRKFGFLSKVPVLTIFSVTFALVCAFWQILFIEKDIAIDICANIFSNISCVSKGIRLSMSVKELQRVFTGVSNMWHKYRTKGECLNKVLRAAAKTHFFVKCYVTLIFGLLISLTSLPVTTLFTQLLSLKVENYTFDYTQRIFPVRYPYSVNNPVIYGITFCQEVWLLVGLLLSWVSCDTLFATLATHLSLQFEILQDDIHTLIDGESDEKRLKENMFIFVNRHREILRICDEVERIFSPVIFLNVLLSSMNICVNMFELRQKMESDNYFDFVNLFLSLNTLLQITVYCTFAETLTQKTISIPDAIYASEWVNKNQQFKVCVQILIIRLQKPFYFTGYGFFAITHQRLTQIVNTTLSYYMMLQTTS